MNDVVQMVEYGVEMKKWLHKSNSKANSSVRG
jgi:hypothetical protein